LAFYSWWCSARSVDIIVARLSETLTLLISVKDYASPAAPLAVQEWAAVTKTMNEHSGSQSYLGLVVCSSGFTEGCPAWAMDYNIGLVPPFKGRPIHYGKDTVVEMLKRSVLALKRLSLSEDLRLSDHKNLFWEVYKCLSEFPEPPGK